jgi:hypothetical protein
MQNQYLSKIKYLHIDKGQIPSDFIVLFIFSLKNPENQ